MKTKLYRWLTGRGLSSQQRSARRILIVMCLLLFLMAVPALRWSHANVKSMAERQNSRIVPIIFIPGSSAGINRFDKMIKIINADAGRRHQHSVMKMEVHTNGRIEYHGRIDRNDSQPFIVVGFENNHDGYDNIKKQIRWFNIAFNQLSHQLKFNRFYAFGHSNGGLIWTGWLEKYYRRYSDEMTIQKLMTVGTPYNLDERSLANRTQMFNDFVKNRHRLPKNLTVYSVTGTETYSYDGIVPENSVWAGKFIYQKRVKNYTTMTVTGKNAEHSDLPQNSQIVHLFEEYLLDNGVNGSPNNRNNRRATNNNQQTNQ